MIFSHHQNENPKDEPFMAQPNGNKESSSALKKFRRSALAVMTTKKSCVRDITGFSDNYVDESSNKQLFKSSILAVIAYILIGSLSFSVWMENWTFIDGMYFTAVTFTTVGYGDLYPVGMGQKIWGAIFIFVGMVVVAGIALGTIFDYLFSMYEEVSNEVKEEAHEHYVNLFSNNGVPDANKKKQKSIGFEVCDIIMGSFTLILCLIVPSIVIGYIEGWSLLTSLYFCAVTATTIGYGDTSPQSQLTRLIAVFYLPLCVAIMANILGKFSNLYLKRKTEASKAAFLSRKLTIKDIQEMDVEGNGAVSYTEFLEFMLVTMGKVEMSDIKELEQLYKKLDTDDSKSLNIQDLVTTANGRSLD